MDDCQHKFNEFIAKLKGQMSSMSQELDKFREESEGSKKEVKRSAAIVEQQGDEIRPLKGENRSYLEELMKGPSNTQEISRVEELTQHFEKAKK